MSAEKNPPAIRILGSPVSAVNMGEACDAIMRALDERRKGYVCVTGVHGLTEAYEDESFRGILEKAFLVTPDGMPLVWLGKMQSRRRMSRVYGPDLMLAVCGLTAHSGHTHFLFGGNPGVADELKLSLEKKFPGIRIVGTHCPPFRPLSDNEEMSLEKKIAELRPDIIWVGLSTPKQERFMAAHIERLSTTLMFGVGAAFDFHTGRVRQAPSWMQRCGLEWLFRLWMEPKRLAKRYLRNNPLFVWRLIKEKLSKQTADAVAKSEPDPRIA